MLLQDIRKITVLGTGMMGPGIALLFARAGYKTALWGPDEDNARRGRQNLRRNQHAGVKLNLHHNAIGNNGDKGRLVELVQRMGRCPRWEQEQYAQYTQYR